MTKEQTIAIENLSSKQLASIKRYWWRAEKAGKPCVFENMQTAEEVVAYVNSKLRNSSDDAQTVTTKPTINLEALTIEELSDLLEQIPGIIESKKLAQIADIDAQIAQLKELKKELTK